MVNGIKKISNKENNVIQQKATLSKNNVSSNRKIFPCSSYVGAKMVKSVRIKT